MIRNVAIIGRGALGIMYAKALMDALGFENVYMIADAQRICRYQQEHLSYNGEPIALNYKKASALASVDLLIFTVKYPGLKEAMQEVKSLIAPHTIVMSFLNGVISEEEILATLRPQHLLYTTVQGMDATFLKQNLQVSHLGFISFGKPSGCEDKDVKDVAALFDKAFFKYELCENIKHQLFSKWMLNVGVNQACAYYGVGYGGVQKAGEARAAMLRAMHEAQAVASYCGIELSDAEIYKWVALIDTLDPNGAPSMEQDRRAGRVNEVGLFAKTVCDIGAKAHIATPQNQLFWEKLRY